MAKKKKSYSTEESSSDIEDGYTYDYYSHEVSDSSVEERTLWQLIHENKKAIARYSFFFLFLAVLIIVANNTRASWLTYEFNERLRERYSLRAYSIKDVEKTLQEQRDAQEMYIFMRDYLLPGVYETTYGFTPNTQAKTTTNELGTILGNLRRVGAPRIRQLRMKKDTCDVKLRFQSFVDTCVAPFAKRDQDKSCFGPGCVWTFEDAASEKVLWIERRVYTSGGFFITLGPDLTSSVNNVTFLMENGFVDVQTRLVDFRMSWYNPYLDTVSVVTIAWEFLASGGARPFSSFHTVELNGFGADRDAAFEITFEIFMWVFTLIFLIEQIVSFIRSGWSYFTSGWNWLNFVILILLLLTIGFRISTIVILDNFEFTVSDTQYVDFSDIEFLRLNERRTMAGVIFLFFFASFQFFESNPKLNQLLRTMEEAGADVILFIIVILIVVFGFIFSGQLLFAETIDGFSRFSTALSTVFRYSLGDFDYNALEDADYSFGPLYFYLVIGVILFLLLNMFLAIIMGAHERVINSVEEQKWAGAQPGPITEAFLIIKNRFRRLFGMKPKRIVTDRERALKAADANQDGLLNANELNQYLRRHPERAADLLGIETAKDLYARFDPTHPLRLSRAEQRALVAVLDTRRQNLVLLEHLLQLEEKLGLAESDSSIEGINLADELSSYSVQ